MFILYYLNRKINNYCRYLTLSRRRSLKASIASFLSLNTSLGSGVLVRLPGVESLLDPLSSSAARNTFSSEKNCTLYNINTITTTCFKHSRSQMLILLLHTTNSLFDGNVRDITHVRLFNALSLFLTCYPCRLQSVILYRVKWLSGSHSLHTLQDNLFCACGGGGIGIWDGDLLNSVYWNTHHTDIHLDVDLTTTSPVRTHRHILVKSLCT